MLRYFHKKDKESSHSNSLLGSTSINSPATEESRKHDQDKAPILSNSNNPLDLSSLEADPADRKPILEYSLDVRDELEDTIF